MSSFLVTKKEVENFVNVPSLKKQQGIFYLYAAEENTIKKLLPPPLEYVAPVVIGYFVQFSNTSFGGPYMEFMIGSPCSYKGEVGVYAYNLMLKGPGAEMGVIVGSNCAGIPKKIADDMEIIRIDNKVTAKVVRHGTTLFQCTIDLAEGKYNDEAAMNFLGMPKKGDIATGGYYFHKFNMTQTEMGNSVFSDCNLVKLKTESRTNFYEAGNLVDIKLQSTPDDPYGELASLKPMGAAYFENDYIDMLSTTKLEKLNTEEVMPYLMSGRYDRAMMGVFSNYLR